tara:strand:- start:2599 stop:3804 length:1206 start_codon:yes stop_codon:yes gene_type:complete
MMIDQTARCPKWLISRILSNGGSISFYQYMDWVLNDPGNGYYSTGASKIGKDGDFCTSPSLGSDFANLLAIQIVEWFLDLEKTGLNVEKFSLVEMGPGEGILMIDLIDAISEISPSLISKLEFVLVEINKGMKLRQEKVAQSLKGVEFRWSNLEELALKPVTGVVIANELLDAFPVERLVCRDDKIFRQGVTLKQKKGIYYLEFIDLNLTPPINQFLKEAEYLLKIEFPPKQICNGWVTEWHCDVPLLFEKLSKVLVNGSLLVVDYAMESKRYYKPSRKTGTLISYKNQEANTNLFKDAGLCDLTSHLCLESTITYAKRNGWIFLGEARQGQALLALGLSKLLYSLQTLASEDFSLALNRRESLLRLVDPMGLGEFRWLAFQKNSCNDFVLRTRFLDEPIN